MIAIDTNVLVRWILLDDEKQLAVARRLVTQPCWVSWTVLLELVWVLGSHGKLMRAQIAEVLDALLAMPTLHFDRPVNLHWAVERYRAGADIADMLHIAGTGDVTEFVSFDKGLRGKAGDKAPVPVRVAQ